jgi:hypothetical protein
MPFLPRKIWGNSSDPKNDALNHYFPAQLHFSLKPEVKPRPFVQTKRQNSILTLFASDFSEKLFRSSILLYISLEKRKKKHSKNGSFHKKTTTSHVLQWRAPAWFCMAFNASRGGIRYL